MQSSQLDANDVHTVSIQAAQIHHDAANTLLSHSCQRHFKLLPIFTLPRLVLTMVLGGVWHLPMQ